MGGGGGGEFFSVAARHFRHNSVMQFMTMCKCVTHFDIAQGELGWIEHPLRLEIEIL